MMNVQFTTVKNHIRKLEQNQVVYFITGIRRSGKSYLLNTLFTGRNTKGGIGCYYVGIEEFLLKTIETL